MEEVVKLAKKRCREAIERIENLSKINQQNKSTLLKLVQSELSFLSRSSTSPHSSLSLNIGHLEAVLHLLEQPFITGVSRVCNSLPLLNTTTTTNNNNANTKSSRSRLYVDIVCTLLNTTKPAWIIVSDRNPHYLHWENNNNKLGFKSRLQQLFTTAHCASTLKPSSLVLFFSNGLNAFILDKLKDDFAAFHFPMDLSPHFHFHEDLETPWVNVLVSRSFQHACVLQINVDAPVSAPQSHFFAHAGLMLLQTQEEVPHSAHHYAFSCLLSTMNNSGSTSFQSVEAPTTNHPFPTLINFDTTSLIALVSGISNGGVDKLLATPETQLRARFKGNYDFVIGQVMSEIHKPMLEQIGAAITGKRGIICETVYAEFKELVSLCGGPNEKLRAEHLLKCLTVVQDTPSDRMMGLPTTRKLAMKNKIVFGCGDYWHAPTLTANMSFVRAVSQTGMSLFTVEHRPRALTGD
ncbi:hypothetical protein ACFE04_009253 [Oxalis oulophora]